MKFITGYHYNWSTKYQFELHRLYEILTLLMTRIFTYKYVSPNIVRLIEWRMIIWTGHVACMKEMKNA
jgi:hypothetical protein